jgi:hypothetical protein
MAAKEPSEVMHRAYVAGKIPLATLRRRGCPVVLSNFDPPAAQVVEKLVLDRLPTRKNGHEL